MYHRSSVELQWTFSFTKHGKWIVLGVAFGGHLYTVAVHFTDRTVQFEHRLPSDRWWE